LGFKVFQIIRRNAQGRQVYKWTDQIVYQHTAITRVVRIDCNKVFYKQQLDM
jgi:hypothetical protein